MAIRKSRPNSNDSRITFTASMSDSATRAATQSADASVTAQDNGDVLIQVGCQQGRVSNETARALASAISDVASYAAENAKQQSGPHFIVEYRGKSGETLTVGPFSELSYDDDPKSPGFDTVTATYAPFASKSGTEKIEGADFIRALPKEK